MGQMIPLRSYRQTVTMAGVDSPQATAFLARTSGLDAAHRAAYRALINGGVTDGWFQKMDILLLFATQDSATALLNLISATYTQSNSGATFTADRGFSLTAAVGQISSTYNPATASSPNFIQDSAHLSYWSTVNGSNGVQMSFGGGPGSNIFPAFTGDGNLYARVNDNPESGGFPIADTRGLFLGNRSGATARQVYRNGVSAGTYGSVASTTVNNAALTMLGDAATPYTSGCAAASVGSSLDGTDQGNFYTRMRAFMDAVGAP